MWPEGPWQSGHLTFPGSTDFHVNALVPSYAQVIIEPPEQDDIPPAS